MKRTEVSADEWKEKFWAQGRTGFHQPEGNKHLVKQSNVFLDGKSDLKIFVPLCGKTFDMKWLHDKGHRIVGVETAVMAIEQYQEEQGIKLTARPISGIEGQVYESDDKRFQIYCCDLFSLTSEIIGTVDRIYDRASLNAINVCDREKYANLMKSISTGDTRILLNAAEYDMTQYAGPPHAVFEKDIQDLYGDRFTIKYLDRSDELTERRKESFGIDWYEEVVYLLTAISE